MKTGFFIKTIFLVVFLVAVSVVPAHTQSNAFMEGARMYLEQQRIMNETRMINQQIKLMRQQSESMREATGERSRELYQNGYMAGYRKGSDDMVAYVKSTTAQTQEYILNFVSNEIFNETSVPNLVEGREAFSRSLNTPNHSIAKLYVTLIDARLVELRQKPIASTPITPSVSITKILTWTFENIRSGAGDNYSVVTTVKQGDKLTVIGESGDWFNVRLEGGQQGWISNRVVK